VAAAGRRRDPPIDPAFAEANGGDFEPYRRDEETLARPWAIPAPRASSTASAGLEKQDVTGNVSYDPENHDLMVRLRAQKVAGIAQDIPELEVDDPDCADTLVLSWGGTYGSVAAGRAPRARGRQEGRARASALPQPVPAQHGEVVRGYEKVLVPEINLGQLQKLIRAEFSSTRTASTSCAGSRSARARSRTAIDAMVDA
jgi:2-oxoglutarate ferredoxin oxidoreductase subunit alpha